MFEDEGYQFMGAAFKVHNQLGCGLAEEVYQQSLEIELELRAIPFLTKHELSVYYKGRQLQTKYKPDLVVCDNLVIELKAVAALTSDHEAQVFNYLRISRRNVGYLVNFGAKGKLDWKRLILTDLHCPSQTESAAIS